MQVSGNSNQVPKPTIKPKKPPVQQQPKPDPYDPYNALPPAFWHGPRS